MKFLWFLLAGATGGVLAGMGMGGGTALIPLLNIFYNVDQRVAQAVNLVSFIPTASVALFVHIKNKLVDSKNILYIIIPALILTAVGCFLVNLIEGDLLKKLFGGFLIILSVVQLILGLKKAEKN